MILLPALQLRRMLTHSPDSPYAFCVTRVPSAGRLSPVNTLPPVRLPIPHAPETIPRYVCVCELLEHLRE